MTDVKYPDITVRLTDTDSHPFSIIGTVASALQRAGVPGLQIEKFKEEAKSGDYDNVLVTAMRWVNVE